MKRVVAVLFVFAAACASTSPDPSAETVPAIMTTPQTEAALIATATPDAPSIHQSGEPQVVTLGSPSPLIHIRVMIKHGSTADPVGREGLAFLTAQAMVDGGFGRGSGRMTKERLAEMTMPWGSDARPAVIPTHRATTFLFTVPRDVLSRYVTEILRPMFTEPAFDAAEIDRIRKEVISSFTSFRSENLEGLGLAAIDQYLLEGTRYAQLVTGTESSVTRLTRDDVIRFYNDFYRPELTIIGISSNDPEVVDQIRGAVREMNRSVTSPPPTIAFPPPTATRGRVARVIAQANAPAASVHLGFPYEVNRLHPDYWPLYVANVWFGQHRDSFGYLYRTIRLERGYNYGNYSYLEYWGGRPGSLFELFNTPREQQSFSIWIRPVKHEHAVHLAQAATWELERFVARGLDAEELEQAKTKARVLYLNLGETAARLLAARVDDAFYGLKPGYLEGYLSAIDGVTLEQVNRALRRHLHTEDIKYLIVTTPALAQDTARLLQGEGPVWGKSWKDYEFAEVTLPDGTIVWQVADAKMGVVQQDAAWAWYPVHARSVEVIPAESLYR